MSVTKDQLLNGFEMYLSDFVEDENDIKKSELKNLSSHLKSLYDQLVEECSEDEMED